VSSLIRVQGSVKNIHLLEEVTSFFMHP
jgi:hypothetical protein